MENATYDLYRDIAARTDGTLFLGVVGPVRTGKSTLIANMMQLLVLPHVADGAAKSRMTDELPQSGSGKTVMTTQPKFVPSESVTVTLNEQTRLNVRMVDCVGYLVPGALGADEEEAPRMVQTPWFDHEIPFEQAAEIGTQKVICDHSTVGLLVTTDGSICGLPRINYTGAEERAVRELKQIGKPFVILLNSTAPQKEETCQLRQSLQEKYEAPVLALDIKNLTASQLNKVLETALYQFPITQLRFDLPAWAGALSCDHWLMQDMIKTISDGVADMDVVADYSKLSCAFESSETLCAPKLTGIDLASGAIAFDMALPRTLFYSILGEQCGLEVTGDRHLMQLMHELVYAKQEYDRVADALKSVRETGYGLVAPTQEELTLEEPELVKQGNRFGVRLKASGPSLHMIKVDIESVITPIIGAEQESAQLIKYMMDRFETDPKQIWETEMFGRSLNDLLKEGLSTKLMGMPEEARGKLQQTLQRIINNGSGGLVCILL